MPVSGTLTGGGGLVVETFLIDILKLLMDAITEKRLTELGFEPRYLPENENGRIENQFEYDKGSINVCRYKNRFSASVYSNLTTSDDYAQPAKGVKTEKDLIELCRLIDG